ncbi:YlxR family protein [Propioniciclava soli]|uniref:YlxR family protein n=1 Tax=Propioniciclava soli TaxID=2775081 RepID=A0ABZ3CDE9_9ACTN
MPIRTCVGCRRADDQAALVRLALTADGLVVGRTTPGRGAWLHPGCGQLALRRRALGRALRGDPGPAEAVAAVLARVDAGGSAWAIGAESE